MTGNFSLITHFKTVSSIFIGPEEILNIGIKRVQQFKTIFCTLLVLAPRAVIFLISFLLFHNVSVNI